MLNHSVGFNSQCPKGIEKRWPKGKAKVKGSSLQQHALKGQKLLAQGIALGYDVRKLVAL